MADDFRSCRDRALLELFYASGLRLCALAALDLAQLDLAAGLLRLPGKDGRPRELPLGPRPCAALQAWLGRRQEVAVEPALFVGRHGRRLTPRAVQQRVRQAGLRAAGAAVPPAVEPAAGQERAAAGEPPDDPTGERAQAYARLDFRYLAQVYRRAHPRARRHAAADDDSQD